MKSIELNWIRKKVDKTIPMPEVLYHPLEYAAGMYYRPKRQEMYDMDGKPYFMGYGIIVINPDYVNETKTESVIAHEWRHHWQYYNGVKFEISPVHLFSEFEYDEALKRYFTESKTELDAVRFEHKYVGVHPDWESSLYNILKEIRPVPIITYGNNCINKQKVQPHRTSIRRTNKTNKKTRRIQRSI